MSAENAFIRVSTLEELRAKGVIVVQGRACPVAVYASEDAVAAVDNRCPHLGFPMNKGTVKDGILTCHWHQARFDLCSGCTFDLWADDLPSYETKVVDGVVHVAAMPKNRADEAYHLRRLHKGMEQNIGLLQAKSLIGLLKSGQTPIPQVIRDIAQYGTQNQSVPGGFTELTIAGNLQNVVTADTAYYILLRASSQIAAASRNSKRQVREALAGSEHTFEQLKRWFYQWVQGRDPDAAERVLLTALELHTPPAQLAEMFFGAVSERVYSNQGHVFDFINKCFELLDQIGWSAAADVLPLALDNFVASRGTEENSNWHHPIEIIEPLRAIVRDLPAILKAAQGKSWKDDGTLGAVLLGEDPLAILEVLKSALANGAPPAELSKRVAYAAAMRLARFAKANEVGDWFNPEHTFIYVNAVHQAVKRTQAPDVVRAIFHAALAVYMDRFLNVPPAKLPDETHGHDKDGLPSDAKELRDLLLEQLNQQSRIDETARIVSRYIKLKHPMPALFDTLAYATVREDLDFHTLQTLEAGFQQCKEWDSQPQAEHILVGVIRNLAAVCPTSRARLRTAITAMRLHHGDRIYEE